jgi:hypothetical protein
MHVIADYRQTDKLSDNFFIGFLHQGHIQIRNDLLDIDRPSTDGKKDHAPTKIRIALVRHLKDVPH